MCDNNIIDKQHTPEQLAARRCPSNFLPSQRSVILAKCSAASEDEHGQAWDGEHSSSADADASFTANPWTCSHCVRYTENHFPAGDHD